MILRMFQLIASTGAQTKKRLSMKMQLSREDRENKKHKHIDNPIIVELRLLQEMFQNRKRSNPVLSLVRPTPAMKLTKCAKVKVVGVEARTL